MNQETASEAGTLRKELAKNGSQEKRLIQAMAEGVLSLEDYTSLKADVDVTLIH